MVSRHFILAALIAAMPAHAQQAEAAATPASPYALRGARLGITLAEFKAFAPPVDDPRFADVQPSCSDAPDFGGILPSSEKQHGVIRCVWISTDTLIPYSRKQPRSVKIADGSGMADFDFMPDEAGTPRLFRITVDSNMLNRDGIYPALVKAYGEPRLREGVVQNRAGATFPKTTASWDNGVSAIFFEEHCRMIRGLCLTYVHHALNARYVAKERERADAAAEKL